ncbi:MAG: hypothetical protein NDJ90_12315 [Oligoflexia bacterium]|nr:hypothetical protein [Oligoflexia bacterium]
MKKMMTCLLGGLMVCSVAFAPRAHAFVGFMTGNPALTVLGFAIAAGPALHGELHGKKPTALTFVAMAAGVVIMDGEGAQKVKFTPVSEQEGFAFGMTRAEVVAYNDETEELNQIFDAVLADLDAMSEPTVDDSAAAWLGYSSAVSVEAYSGARKLVKALLAE